MTQNLSEGHMPGLCDTMATFFRPKPGVCHGASTFCRVNFAVVGRGRVLLRFSDSGRRSPRKQVNIKMQNRFNQQTG